MSQSSDFINTMTELIQTDGAPKSLPLQVTSDTCGPHEIKLVFGGTREYSVDDDSELVKKIKSFNVLDDTDLTFKGGYIFRKSGGFGLDDPFSRDFEYKCAYINKRDANTKKDLQDKEQIDFILIPNGLTIDDFENEDVDKEEFILEYQKFINNSMKIDGLGLFQGDNIALNSSYCNVLYKYPMFQNHTVFTIQADDEITGFTKKELALKIMQRYHMLYFLSKNYDIEKGIITQNDMGRKAIFRPVMYDDQWSDNGVLCLQYHKDLDQWEFICADYI